MSAGGEPGAVPDPAPDARINAAPTRQRKLKSVKQPKPHLTRDDVTKIRREILRRPGDCTDFYDILYTLDIQKELAAMKDDKIANFAKTIPYQGLLAKLNLVCKSTPKYFDSRQYAQREHLSDAELEKFLRDNITCYYKFFGAPTGKGIIWMAEDTSDAT